MAGYDQALEREIAALMELDRTGLLAAWYKHYRTDPPKGISQGLLVRVIAYAMQAKRCGGLKPAIKRRLAKAAEPGRSGVPATRQLHPGARLVREWNGATHIVEVVDSG